MLNVPVALFLFNRPDTTREVFEQIRAVQPRTLLLIADGPRRTHPDDVAGCAAARAVVEQGIDWACDVRRNFADENLGCGRRVASGLDWVFATVEAAIILEDDCRPEPIFFDFCAELLARYAGESRIGSISGSNFQRCDVTGGAGYYFSRHPHSWGWATWRRSWQHYDYAMRGWPELDSQGWLRRILERAREESYWKTVFDRTWRGEIDTWDYQWTFASWRHDLLTILPAANLVENIGFGRAATHTAERPANARRTQRRQVWPLCHPAMITRNAAADRYTADHHFDPPVWLRAYRRLSRSFSRP